MADLPDEPLVPDVALPRRPLSRVLRRAVARHPLVLVVPLLVIGLIAVGVLGPTLARPSASAPPADEVQALGVPSALGPPAMALQSMEAMRDLDAEAFWNALDDEMRQNLASQGVVGPVGVQQMFDQIRASGHAIKSFRFVARYDTADGKTVSFFVAQRVQPDGQEAEVPFLITTNKDGLVVKLE